MTLVIANIIMDYRNNEKHLKRNIVNQTKAMQNLIKGKQQEEDQVENITIKIKNGE